MIKKCLECSKKFEAYRKQLKFCSMKCYHKQSVVHKKGMDSPFWKGSKASVASTHDWLKSINGSAFKCQNRNCLKKSKQFDWALINGRKYKDRNLDDYIQLCRRCHKAYDFVEDKHPRNKKGIFI